MKKIMTVILIISMLFMCSCKPQDDESVDSKESTTLKTTSAPATVKSSESTQSTEPVKVFTKKEYSKDKFFSLCYYVSSKNVKGNDTVTIITKLKNESKYDFKVGIKDMKNPVSVPVIKKDTPWGYEGNSDPLSSTFKAGQEIVQEIKVPFKQAGVYQVIIYADFAREIKDFEDTATVEKNIYDETLANSSIFIDMFEITVS